MKTKAVLLTLLVLVTLACSNDDNNPVEEQEEMIEYKIKKAIFTYQNWTRELIFDLEGRLTTIGEIYVIDGTEQYVSYEYVYNQNNQITERTRYVDGQFGQEQLTFVYDSTGRLSEIYSFNGSETFLIHQFTYYGNTMEVLNTMTAHSFRVYYTLDSQNRIVKMRSQNLDYGYYIIYDYIYSEENLTEIILSYEDCTNCEGVTTTITYDNKPNPLFENLGNKFYYYTLGNPITNLSRNHYSHNNYLTFTTDSNNPLNYSVDPEYNDDGYPTSMKEFSNGNQIYEITFEYYE